MLPDRHARKPVGGEVEAGYGIGNRHLHDDQTSPGHGRESPAIASHMEPHFALLALTPSGLLPVSD